MDDPDTLDACRALEHDRDQLRRRELDPATGITQLGWAVRHDPLADSWQVAATYETGRNTLHLYIEATAQPELDGARTFQISVESTAFVPGGEDVVRGWTLEAATTHSRSRVQRYDGWVDWSEREVRTQNMLRGCDPATNISYERIGDEPVRCWDASGKPVACL